MSVEGARHAFGTGLVDRLPAEVETTAPETPAPPPSVTADVMKRFLHVLVEPRSCLNAFYLLIAFPLGLTYFFVLITGAVSGPFLSIVVVGVMILLATLVAAWGLRHLRARAGDRAVRGECSSALASRPLAGLAVAAARPSLAPARDVEVACIPPAETPVRHLRHHCLGCPVGWVVRRHHLSARAPQH